MTTHQKQTETYLIKDVQPARAVLIETSPAEVTRTAPVPTAPVMPVEVPSFGQEVMTEVQNELERTAHPARSKLPLIALAVLGLTAGGVLLVRRRKQAAARKKATETASEQVTEVELIGVEAPIVALDTPVAATTTAGSLPATPTQGTAMRFSAVPERTDDKNGSN